MKTILKKFRYVFFLIASAIIGVIVGIAFPNIHIEITSLLIWAVSLFVAFLFSTLLHELAHAVYFVTHGIRMSLIAIFVFVLYKKDNKWKFKINVNTLTLSGGIAIPELPPITNEYQFSNIQKIYGNSLLIAPLVSLVQAIIAVVLLVIIALNGYASFYTSLLLSTFITGLTIFFTSFSKTNNIYGDFPASINFKKNNQFATIQLCQYMLFEEKWKENITNSKWIIDKIENYIKTSADKINCIKMADLLLQLDYLGIYTINSEILKLVNDYYEHSSKYAYLFSQEDYGSFYYHVCFYLNKKGAIDSNELYLHINSFPNLLSENKKLKTYYSKLTDYIFGILDDKDAVYRCMFPFSGFSLLKEFNSVIEIEKSFINQMRA